MKKSLYILLILTLLAIFVAIFAYINQEKLIERFIENQAGNASFHNELLEDKESITLITVGTGAPLPSDRAQSCNVIIVNGKFFVFDLGEGSLEKLEDLRLPIDKVNAVFISHWHSDHFIDLPGLINRSWQLGRVNDLYVYGPKGVNRVVSAIDSLLVDENIYRMEHHGAHIMDPQYARGIPYEIDVSGNEMVVLYDQEGIKISAFSVSHEPVSPSYGFRVDYKGKSVVYSGDCSYDERLIEHAQGADILIHEAMQKDFISRASALQVKLGNTRNAQILKDVVGYHSTPQEAAQVAQKANVKKLILSHLAPAPGNPISRRFFNIGLDDIYKGPILLAEDGDIYTIK
jgi:ribonuclease Z